MGDQTKYQLRISAGAEKRYLQRILTCLYGQQVEVCYRSVSLDH